MREVVVTGLGAVTPSGHSADELWASVVSGRSAIDVLQGEQFASLPVRIGAQVLQFTGEDLIEAALARRISPVQRWAIAAADEALHNAGATDDTWDPQRVSVIVGTGSGPIDAMQEATRRYDAKGPRAVPLSLSMHGAPDSAAALLSQRHGFRGSSQGISATCASSAIALGEGMRRIRHGYADAVLVVGMEDCLGPINLASNANLRALATGYESDPTRASRPFDADRAGFVMAQGAAAILLESADGARARGAARLAALAGFGSSSDAHHPTAPHPQGRGAAEAMRAAILDAEVTPADVDHVNAHGTGTPAGDAAEALSLETVFGKLLSEIPVTATKSSTGHLLGASGVVEAIIAVRSLMASRVPPTLNLETPEFELDIVAGPAREVEMHSAMSTSFGFGGHNAALLFTREGA